MSISKQSQEIILIRKEFHSFTSNQMNQNHAQSVSKEEEHITV